MFTGATSIKWRYVIHNISSGSSSQNSDVSWPRANQNCSFFDELILSGIKRYSSPFEKGKIKAKQNDSCGFFYFMTLWADSEQNIKIRECPNRGKFWTIQNGTISKYPMTRTRSLPVLKKGGFLHYCIDKLMIN